MTFCLCGHHAGSHNRLRFNCLAVSDQNLRCSCSKFEPARDTEQNVGKTREDSGEREETAAEIRSAPVAAAPSGARETESPLTTKAIVLRAKDELGRVCAGRGGKTSSGLAGHSWRMSVPVRADDSDMIFADVIMRCAGLDAALATERATLDRLRERVKLLDRVIGEHHSASVMREEHYVCPVCTEYGGGEFFSKTSALLRATLSPEPT